MNPKEEFLSLYSVNINQDVIWGDMDAFQHVNNTIYFRYFENVRIEYFEQVGINALMAKNQIGPILGRTTCEYLAPLTYPDQIIIGTNVTQLREKRFSMDYAVFSCKLSKVAAKGTAEIVYYDYNANKTCPIPESLVNTMENY